MKKTDATEDAAFALIEEDARFRAALLEGKQFADREIFIEEAEMDARFAELLRGSQPPTP